MFALKAWLTFFLSWIALTAGLENLWPEEESITREQFKAFGKQIDSTTWTMSATDFIQLAKKGTIRHDR